MSWYSPTVAFAGQDLPLSVQTVKDRCGIDTARDDGIIGQMIAEVLTLVEQACNLCIFPKTLVAQCDDWADLQRLPDGPLRPGTMPAISYTAPDGTEQVLEPARYRLLKTWASGGLVPVDRWPQAHRGAPITVTYQVGFDDLPLDLRLAVVMRVAELYGRPENQMVDNKVSEFDRLLVNWRRGV